MPIFFMVLSFVMTHYLMPQLADLASCRLTRANYANIDIPVGLGLVFLFVVIPLAILAVVFAELTMRDGFIWLVTIMSFGLLGFVDDTLGSREARGFAGHFRALRQGHITTGALKALFGAGIAFLVTLLTSVGGVTVVVNTLLIALFANFFNLLDVRPGRSGKVFLLLTLGLSLLALTPLPILILAASLLAYIRWDLEAKVMMGDTGANILGAAYGLAILTLPLVWKLVILLCLVILHWYAERTSLSELIEAQPILQKLDAWGRKKV